MTDMQVTAQRHRRLTVARVVAETPEACSVHFELDRSDTGWFHFRPGQFVTVRVPHPDGEVARCYSLSTAPGDDRPAITIKRAGPASSWLCDNIAAGWTLDVLPPAGLFTPTSMDQDLLLIAAGSGITPIMSIVRAVMAQGSGHVVLVYANRDPGSVIFGRQLELLSIRHTGRLRLIPWLESEAGLPSATALVPLLRPYADREVYLCGPEPFMAQVHDALTTLDVPRHQVHRERFVSLDGDPFAEPADPPPPPGGDAAVAIQPDGATDSRTVAVTLDGSRHQLTWPDNVTLLDLLTSAGLGVPSSCRSGQCGACTTRVEQGRVSMLANDVLDDQDLAEGYILACQSLPLDDQLRVTYD
jgi:3-ketosteroid 9alpha-monooxygenase subunit B